MVLSSTTLTAVASRLPKVTETASRVSRNPVPLMVVNVPPICGPWLGVTDWMFTTVAPKMKAFFFCPCPAPVSTVTSTGPGS